MSLVNYRPSESPVAQMSVVAGLVASTAQALSLSFQEKSVLLRICQSFGSSVTYDVYRSVDGVVDSDPMVSGVSDAFYLSVILGQENSILVLSLQADGYYPILLTVSYLYEKDLLFISQVGATGDMKYKMFNSTELSQNLDYTIDLFTAVPDLSIDTLPEVIDFLSGFVTTDNLKQYIADQVDIFEIVQGPGNSTTAVMSQNAVTEELLRKVGVDAVVDTTGNSSNLVMSQASVTEELSKKASVESVTDGISAHNTSSTSHADIRNLLNTCVGLPAYDSSSYKITFTTLAGASVEIDLPIEQLALRYNAETDSIEFDNADGTTTSIPVSAFVKEYVGSIGDRIQVSIDENNVIHATILKNSIDWGCLSFELQERINDHVTSADFATKAVRTDIEQTLSTEAQNQALENIGIDLVRIPYSLLGTTLDDATYAKIKNANGLILTDAPSEYYGPLEFICGANNSDGTKVFAGLNLANTSAYIVLYVNHNLTNVRYARTYDGAVPYDASKTLTSAQQDVALSNIGLDFVHIDYSVIGTTLNDKLFNQIANAKGVIINNHPDGLCVYIRTRGIGFPVTFFTIRDATTVTACSLSDTDKKLTLSGPFAFSANCVYYINQTLTNTQKQQARTNIGAARGQDIQNITGSAPTLSIVGGVTYVCGELTTLTVNSIEDSTDESWVYFTSGSTPTVVTWPTGANIAGDTTIVPNVSYEVCIRKSRIIIVHYEQS